MSDSLTMDVLMVREHYNHVAGAPDADDGELINVPFITGAKLVASGYAVAAPETEDEFDIPEQEIVEIEEEDE